MSIILLIAILGAIVFKFNKKPISKIISKDNKVVQLLQNAKWYQNPWAGGVFLFLVNAVLFTFTIFGLYLAIYFSKSFVLLIVILLGVIGSIYSWLILNNAWQGTKRNRMKMGLVGSSFYALLTLVVVYLWATLKPAYSGEDTFMSGMGFVFGIFLTIIAFSTCLVVTNYSKQQEAN
ncbi:hypothetical protein [Paenibacillus glacialis]|uniref:Uncharacterized protein n=1 Tax=Paenibacillus glacialis TaxID=494026 RepID=A0A168BWY3_9BACL|nr:hypothetical protein [Paenibacillus glacialis]OAB32846.1 hypothetical protein PGLA_25455 [Paenibacillus glacialis]